MFCRDYWSLDSAKLNRVLSLSVPDLDEDLDDLIDTSLTIANLRESEEEIIEVSFFTDNDKNQILNGKEISIILFD